MTRTVFMFSGQGSQYYQMGRGLYEQPSVFRHWMDRLDALVRQRTGCSVVDALYKEGRTKAETFDRTAVTHPAIFMVEYALAQSLIHSGVTPHLVLGASMGSFAAAAVAGVIDAEDALTAVIQQASALEACCQQGGMIAILAEPRLYDEDGMRRHCEVAAFNFASHFVVAARQDSLDHVESRLRARRVAFQRLPVSFAFHSRWIEEARAPCEALLRSVSRKPAATPIVCCARSTTLGDLPDDYFWSVAREPVRFQQTVASLEERGSYRYIDVGPAGTLATFVRYALPATSASRVQVTLTPFGRDLESVAAVTAGVERV